TDIYMVKGQTYLFPSEVAAEDGSGAQQLTWVSSDPSTLKVTSRYKATAKKSTEESGGAQVTIRMSEAGSGPNVHIVNPYLVQQAEDGSTSLVKKAITLLPGERASLSLEGFGGYRDCYSVFWQSSNDEVAKVEDGTVCAIAKGSTKISAYVNGKAYTASVKVADVKNAGTVSSQTISLAPLQTLTPKFADGFSIKNAEFTADEEHPVKVEMKKNGKLDFVQNNVVRITAAGKITAVGVGTTTITAVKNGVSKSFTVSVQPPSPTIVYMNAGASKTLKFYNVKASANGVSWKSDNESLTGNAAKGKLKAPAGASGKATVTCLCDSYHVDGVEGTGFTYTAIVYVENPRLVAEPANNFIEKTTGQKYTLALQNGETYFLQKEGVSKPILFQSSKNTVAFVDEAGMVYARGKGKATLSAKVNGKKISVAVTVN
ncbi:MAG: hypothetical protein IJU50_02520, partial [Lachnospiraceae bacterium]|nr:hypothetical protein [Lachnospiraceae bacterium]